MLRKALVLSAVVIAATGCRDRTIMFGLQLGSPCDDTFCVALPIAAKDTAFVAYGVWPFGVHGADHALDGHPGWDIEFKPGGTAIAAESGTVQSLFADTTAGTTTVQLYHSFLSKNYRTVYTSLASVAAGITAGAWVARGQVLGTPKTQTRMIGSRNVTYAAIHFQVDDFSVTSGLTNVNAVSPRLKEESGQLFRAMWLKSGYMQELCEPYASNPRSAVYPLTRRWTLPNGTSTVFVEVTCQNSATQPFLCTFAGTNNSGSGTLLVNPLAGGSAEIDFNLSGTVQRGLYRIVSDTLYLQMAPVGSPRPVSLLAPVAYVTH